MPLGTAASVGDAPRSGDPGLGFVVLALRLARVAPGLIDSVWVDAATVARVDAEPVHDPRRLADDARVLIERATTADLEPARRRSLVARTRALRSLALRLSGDTVSWLDAVETAFGVRPEQSDPQRYLDAHAQLAAVLPGPAPLVERYSAYRRSMTCPAHRVADAVTALSRTLRSRTDAWLGVPAHDDVEWNLTSGAPWAAACQHLGAGRSRISLDLTGPVRLASLPGLVAHEAYPGHHLQGCRADTARVARGWIEHAVTVVATPDCLVAEGAAETALGALMTGSGAGPGGWAAFATEVYAGLGLHFDASLATAVSTAVSPLEDVRADAALLLHEVGRPEAEVRRYLADYGLMTPERVDQSMAFLTHPLWRYYVATYGEGGRLVSAWLEGRPSGESLAARYTRLLDEPLLPRDLASALLAGT